jgi:type III pantothenate kinase
MLLAIDIGNTNIVIGIYCKNELKIHWRLYSKITRTSDESYILLNMLLRESKIHIADIEGAVISSVVPNVTPAFTRMFEQYTSIAPIIVDSDLDLGIKILYKDPKAVGADRIVNAVAGFERYGGPLIIVDFGTATTFDVITENNEYLGGIIVPGVETSASVLHRYAARLPKVELKFPDRLIGNTTESSIQSGLMFGTVELIDGLIRRIQKEMQKTVKIVATGGLASLIIPHSQTITQIEPFLTLEGLRIIYEKVTRQQQKA